MSSFPAANLRCDKGTFCNLHFTAQSGNDLLQSVQQIKIGPTMLAMKNLNVILRT
jgi:hypothetical protein